MRKVLSNHNEVAHYWANQLQSEGRSGNVFFEGPTIYSYGRHFPVAKIIAPGVVALTTRSYSVTTSMHQSLVRRACNHLEQIYVIQPTATAMSQYEATCKDVTGWVEQSKRARTRKHELMGHAYEAAKDFNRYAEVLGEEIRIHLEGAEQWLADDKKRTEEREERERQASLEAEARNKESIDRWLAGEDIRCPHTFRPRLRLRFGGGEEPVAVETSWGATVPIDAAQDLWRLIRVTQHRGEVYRTKDPLQIGPYTLDHIEPSGAVQIGCHWIEYPEIERMARQLGLLKEEEDAVEV